MIRYLVRRLPSLVIVIVLSSMVAFLLPRLAPGDPAVAMAGPDASADQVAAIRKAAGLDLPLVTQYLNWVGGIFHGNLGESYIYHRPVAALIGGRLESTFELALLAAIFMIVLGFVLGVLGGSRLSKGGRTVLDIFNTAILAMPPFLVAIVLILLFGVASHLLPVSGEIPMSQNFWQGFKYLILPAVALALTQGAVIGRLLQTSMLTTRSEDFVDLALAKGATGTRITFRHVLPASLDSAIVAVGLRIGELISGAIIIEQIFARSGLGSLAIQAVNNRDYFVLQALIIGAVIIAVIAQVLSEVTMAAVDPRIRLES